MIIVIISNSGIEGQADNKQVSFPLKQLDLSALTPIIVFISLYLFYDQKQKLK